jgi:hypothetical protein
VSRRCIPVSFAFAECYLYVSHSFKDRSEGISVQQSRVGTSDSLKQLRTMAEGQAFPEMRPMMKRFLQESDNSVDMAVRFR